MKKTVWLIIMAALLLLAGCNVVQLNPERDAATIVAKVEGEEITKGEFNQQYQLFKYYYQITEDYENSPDNAEIINEMKQVVLESLVEQKVLMLKAKELGGYDLSEEQKEELEAEKEDSLNSYKMALKTKLKGESGNEEKSDEELEQMAEEGLDAYIESLGMDIDEQLKSLEDQMAQENLYKKITDLPQPSEPEIQALYDQKVTEQQTGFADGSLNYEQLVQQGQTICFNPDNARKAQHILIKLEQEDIDAIGQLRQGGDDEAADQRRSTALEGIKEAADAAYERAKGDEEFTALIKELGEDPGMESNEYYVVQKDTQGFVTEFAEGLFSLENVGDITKPVATDYGYHIIKYYEEVPAGIVNFEDVRQALNDEVYKKKQEAFFADKLNEWKEGMNIKTYLNRVK